MKFNLLRDQWIPVSSAGSLRRISLRELLTSEKPCSLAHPRSELELSTAQMLSALCQTVFTPKTDAELVRRFRTPLKDGEYDEMAAPFLEWFDVCGDDRDRKYFMQGLLCPETEESKEDRKITGMQKLFPGLPEGGESGCLNVARDRIRKICPSCAAMALFNQASGAPSFGGGFKVSLRGESPLTTMVYNRDARKMAWANVLSMENETAGMLFSADRNNLPSWIDPPKAITNAQKKAKDKNGKSKYTEPVVDSSKFGFLRGLFWQPLSLEILWTERKHPVACDVCGLEHTISAEGFFKQQAYFIYSPAYWAVHPYSPFALKKGEKGAPSELIPLTAKRAVPAWTMLGDIFPPENTGGVWSSAVENYKRVFASEQGALPLAIGGYKNEKSKIEQRRHEIVSLAAGWDNNIEEIRKIVAFGTSVLYKVLFGAVNAFYDKGDPKVKTALKSRAEELYYAATELEIKAMIADTSENFAVPVIKSRLSRFQGIVRDVLGEVLSVYSDTSFKLRDIVRAEDAADRLFYRNIKQKYDPSPKGPAGAKTKKGKVNG